MKITPDITRIMTQTLAAAAVCLLCAGAWAGDLRWQEAAYGVSLSPPPGAVQFEQGRAVSWKHPGGYAISFEIIHSDVYVTLEEVAGAAVVQMGFARATPRIVAVEGQDTLSNPRPQRIAEQPGIKMFFDIEEESKADWLYGQTIVMLGPHTAVVLKLHVDQNRADAGRAAYEVLLDSLHVPLAHELNEMRQPLVEAADRWMQSLGPDDLRAALPSDQWYRLIFKGQDVGHTRIRSSSDSADLRRLGYAPPGTVVMIDSRQMFKQKPLDTRTVIFCSDDGRTEIWKTTASLRGVGAGVKNNLPRRHQPTSITWSEIGARGLQPLNDRDATSKIVNVLTVITETPPASDAVQQIQKHERFIGKRHTQQVKGKPSTDQWIVPDQAYLSQAHVLVFAGMLPAERATYCFSAYHPASGKPGLRTVEVYPQDDGGLLVLDRPNSHVSPTRIVFDADHNFVERISPIGLILRPTTQDELRKIYKINGP